MRLHPWFRLAALAGMAVSLAACSTIAGLFPDKQKQYRYSSELPDLEVPPDLIGTRLKEASAAYGPEPGNIEDTGAPKAGDPSPPPPKKRKAPKHDAEPIMAQSADDNAAVIEVSEPYAQAWNDVSRALGRMKVEITDQNRSDGVFYVYYGGVAPKKPGEEEPGLWDSFKSMLSVEHDQAQEYRVKLTTRDNFTFVRVYDQDGTGLSEGPGLDLLKRLHKKLTTLNQPEPEGEEARKAEEAEKRATEHPGSEEAESK